MSNPVNKLLRLIYLPYTFIHMFKGYTKIQENILVVDSKGHRRKQ